MYNHVETRDSKRRSISTETKRRGRCDVTRLDKGPDRRGRRPEEGYHHLTRSDFSTIIGFDSVYEWLTSLPSFVLTHEVKRRIRGLGVDGRPFCSRRERVYFVPRSEDSVPRPPPTDLHTRVTAEPRPGLFSTGLYRNRNVKVYVGGGTTVFVYEGTPQKLKPSLMDDAPCQSV